MPPETISSNNSKTEQQVVEELWNQSNFDSDLDIDVAEQFIKKVFMALSKTDQINPKVLQNHLKNVNQITKESIFKILDSYIKSENPIDGSLRGTLTDIKEMEQTKESSQNIVGQSADGSF